MDINNLRNVLQDFQASRLSLDEAIDKLKILPYEDLEFVKIDHHRMIRQGFPEVIFCQGKTAEQVATIMKSLAVHNHSILATRATEAMYAVVKAVLPEAQFYEIPKIIYVKRDTIEPDSQRFVLVMSAGTSDIPVAEEAAVTAEIMGNKVERVYDVGVAGIHRLFAHQDIIQNANVIIVAAGMEGALASVVGGMVAKPVIALPTSIGYGASFNGLAALLSMLNSCAAGISVVNIDNGFGAGRLASIINKMR
ncbi:nickel pincer cofactor biosynthesis protein LarB [Pelosinus fermentans]|uniref:1-(5-phosphoribosyl)-5-amino-4-imidazole-carboxylate (AIR) carboxylase n=1 Tax=Pelosinus fermentans JBW45 TaxID=1192197 RepID=I9DGX3_9FIRM|nr:nickel pincer cofactor biosynthesis protein LarB [Pelosinus fermentans]AJQ27716.1 1-(5-phosphoribosyl)-5-amino-4-imidazole-carboxylate (AIR) carboxylase [Pelosinus fermentans JBW45]